MRGCAELFNEAVLEAELLADVAAQRQRYGGERAGDAAAVEVAAGIEAEVGDVRRGVAREVGADLVGDVPESGGAESFEAGAAGDVGEVDDEVGCRRLDAAQDLERPFQRLRPGRVA